MAFRTDSQISYQHLTKNGTRPARALSCWDRFSGRLWLKSGVCERWASRGRVEWVGGCLSYLCLPAAEMEEVQEMTYNALLGF